MIHATEAALNELTNHFKDQEPKPIRVHLTDGGCSGLQLALALDESRDGDESYEHGGFTFLINEEVAKATGDVTVDMTQYGFAIQSENPIGGGGCAGCASAGSCG